MEGKTFMRSKGGETPPGISNANVYAMDGNSTRLFNDAMEGFDDHIHGSSMFMGRDRADIFSDMEKN
eukprot:4951240-Karenia_brevis.AAC.1